jgi:hypothetical protein
LATLLSFGGTYKLLTNPQSPNVLVDNPTSITVDPQNKFTVATIPGNLQAPSVGAQGKLNDDGTFVVPTSNGQARFTGKIDPTSQTATVTVERVNRLPFTVVLPRAADFNPLPGAFVGTFIGFATNPVGDQLRVLMTIDPAGNSTFEADLIQRSLTLRFSMDAYQVTVGGQLIGLRRNTDGLLQAVNNSLVLSYNWVDSDYQSVFQVPLIRQ